MAAMGFTLALMSTLTALDAVFADEQPPVCKARKMQSWSDKIANATCEKQVERDLTCKCCCSTQCQSKLFDCYESKKECVDAIHQLRSERTAGTASDESIWLFSHLYNSRSRSNGVIQVAFRLDGVDVCEEYFTAAMGFTFPNRRIQKFVRLIKVCAFYFVFM